MDEAATRPGRPDRGFGHYLRDMVYGAVDGVITTLAVVAGASGASLPADVGLILGIANLFADGISMGASNFLGIKSEIEQGGGSVVLEKPLRHGLATLAAFVVVGAAPLFAYVLPRPPGLGVLGMAVVLAALALGAAGIVRAPFVHRSRWRSALEMIGIAALAAAVAFVAGGIARRALG
ncbi:VIT1/CCC1 transporter family protein [Myxococcota bacterium]|nr:VIT1/CCC1 transporter family protein [Myxococcota bacterium]